MASANSHHLWEDTVLEFVLYQLLCRVLSEILFPVAPSVKGFQWQGWCSHSHCLSHVLSAVTGKGFLCQSLQLAFKDKMSRAPQCLWCSLWGDRLAQWWGPFLSVSQGISNFIETVLVFMLGFCLRYLSVAMINNLRVKGFAWLTVQGCCSPWWISQGYRSLGNHSQETERWMHTTAWPSCFIFIVQDPSEIMVLLIVSSSSHLS